MPFLEDLPGFSINPYSPLHISSDTAFSSSGLCSVLKKETLSFQLYSRVHISSDIGCSKIDLTILKKPSITQKKQA